MDTSHTARLHLELDLEFIDPDAVQEYARSWAQENSDGDPQTLAGMLEQVAEGPESAMTMMVEPSDIVGSIPGVQAVGATMWVQGAGEESDEDALGEDEFEDFEEEDSAGDSEESWLTKLFNDGAKLPGLSLLLAGAQPGSASVDAPGTNEHEATMLKGAIHWAYETFIDELLNDVALLRESPEAIEDTLQLARLPEEYQASYSPLFAQQLLAVSFDLGLALATSFQAPSCRAQEFAFALILDQVEQLEELLPNLGLGNGWRQAWEPTSATPAEVSAWFIPFSGFAVNPYAVNED